MKIIQFIHPMFLAALGLHASLLFVPIGGESEPELIEEDVPLAELTENASRATDRSTPEKLPVPDLNVASEKSGAAKPATPGTANPAAITQPKPAPRPAPIRVASSAAIAAQPAQSGATGALAASGSGNSSSGTSSAGGSSVADAIRSAADSNESASGGSSNGSPASNPQASDAGTTDGASASPAQSMSFIPNLSTSDEDGSVSEGNSVSGNSTESGTAIPVENAKLSQLIAALPSGAVVPDSLADSVLALQKALLYQPEETTDERAAQMREAWISAVNRGVSAAERIELPEEEDLVLAYPIASSVLRDGRSLDVCLDEAPSNVEIGLLFNEEGELAGEPAILRSTGYEALDIEAIAMIKDEETLQILSAAATEKNLSHKSYIFEIEVDYDKDACISP